MIIIRREFCENSTLLSESHILHMRNNSIHGLN